VETQHGETLTERHWVKAISVYKDHPVTEFMRRKSHRLVGELENAGATPRNSVKYDDFVQHMASLSLSPWGRADVDAWLSVLAAVRVLSWRERELTLNDTPLRWAIQKWA
jgi:hypothetical protein